MKNADFLYHSFQEKEAVLLNFIKKTAQQDYNNEDLKKVRVGIKKMRATFLLLTLTNKKFKEETHLKDLNILFKKAGKLRDNLISQQLLHKYWFSKQCTIQLEKSLKTQLKEDRKKLQRAAAGFKLQKLEKTSGKVKGLCTATPVSRLRAKARAFIAGKINLIRQATTQGLDIEGLHDVRRHLRIITSLAALFSEHGLPILTEKRLRSLKRLQGLLGEWHDLEMLADLALRIMTGLPENAIRAEWAYFHQKLQVENEQQMAMLKKEMRSV